MPELDPPTPEELEQCPFCAGREDRTPPHALVLPEHGAWQVRVVPNLYPALDRQEVAVHVPRHARSVGELDGEELDLVAEAWQRRRASVPEGYLHVLVNEGRAAGSSLPHTHSQLVWLPDAPSETQHRVDREHWAVVQERGGIVVACPNASRLPYECVIAPLVPRSNAFGDEMLAPALRLLAEAIRGLQAAVGPMPLNAWLHDSEDWHLELLPRLSVLAGLELGAGIYLNPVPPDEAAGVLSRALTGPTREPGRSEQL